MGWQASGGRRGKVIRHRRTPTVRHLPVPRKMTEEKMAKDRRGHENKEIKSQNTCNSKRLTG